LRAATAAIILVAFAPSLWAQNALPVSNARPADRTFNLLVLGDSIMWGQGLRDEHKEWFQIKSWLQQNVGRDVREYIEAHSGAVVGSPDDVPSNYQMAVDGEVALGGPSINAELSRAVKTYGDPSQVDLVMVDGCINDVNVLNLLNGGNSPDEIGQLVTSKCGAPMESLLSRVASSFPNAHIVVTGYYPVISEKTPDSLLLRFVARTFYRSTPQGPKLSGKQLRERLIALSQSWHQVSNDVLRTAVNRTNAELTARSSRQRVVFVEIPFLPDYSFATRETRLWGFNNSFLRKLLVIISLGRIPLKTDDERLNQRVASCKEFYNRPVNESSQDKKTRELRRTICRYASIGHPNRKGALIYSEAIINQIKQVVGDVGWLRYPNLTTVPASGP
jgi:lysophospholipase L1-like esterase